MLINTNLKPTRLVHMAKERVGGGREEGREKGKKGGEERQRETQRSRSHG